MEGKNDEFLNQKEERSKYLLKEIEKYFKKMKEHSPSELKEEIHNSLDQFNILTQSSERDQLIEKIDRLNTIINKTSDIINNYDDIDEKTKRYLTEIKKSMYKLNAMEKKVSSIRKSYHNGEYEGDYLNGKREGKGTYIYDSGDRYEGGYKMI